MGQIEAREQQEVADGRLAWVYARYASSVRKRCFRLTGDAVAAEDLMQEVFARFLARFEDVPVSLNTHGYLLATARNIWINQLRKDGDVVVTEIDESRTADDRIENDPVRRLLLAEQRTDVQRGAAGLTERQRGALALRELEGRSYGEIGAEMGLGTNAVAQVVWRARTQLRRSVRRSQIDVEVLPEGCRARLDAMSDLVDETSSTDTAGLEAHIADCGDCRRTLAAYQEAGSRLRGVAPFVPLFAIMARISTALRAGAELPASIGTAAAVTAAVVATAGGGGALVAHYTASAGVTTTAPLGQAQHTSNRAQVVPGSSAARVIRRTVAHEASSSRPSRPPTVHSRHRRVRAASPLLVKAEAVSVPEPVKPVAATPRPPTATPSPAPANPPVTVDSRPVRPPEETEKADKAKKAEKPKKEATSPPGQAQTPASTRTPPGQSGAHGKSQLAKQKVKPAKNAGDQPAGTPAAVDKAHPSKHGADPTSPSAPASGDGSGADPKPHGHAGGKPASPANDAIVPMAAPPTPAGSSEPDVPGAAPATANEPNPHSKKAAETAPPQTPPPATPSPAPSPAAAPASDPTALPTPPAQDAVPPSTPADPSSNGKAHAPK